MAIRREGRESAVQFFYQRDIQGPEAFDRQDLAVVMREFWATIRRPRNAQAFAESLIRGTREHLPEIDRRLQEAARNWTLDRMSAVDRNVLRVAAYEMLYCEETPPVVAMNEAIEIAKRLSTPEAGKFVNGILDRLKEDVLRPLRHASGSAE
ncbi:MAG: transcription antitermination factor NusB [Verrucomicrobiota bacterium]